MVRKEWETLIIFIQSSNCLFKPQNLKLNFLNEKPDWKNKNAMIIPFPKCLLINFLSIHKSLIVPALIIINVTLLNFYAV